MNVYSRLREENPQESISEIVRKVSELTGVSKRTVFRLKMEKKTLSTLSSPDKKRPGAVGLRKRLVKYDDFTLSCIRRKIHGFFRKNEIPTLSEVLKEVNDDAEIFSKNISRSTLYRLLKDMGFTFEKRKRQAVLLERHDIILWRRNYLRKIRELREENAPIYYLDETWVNEGHSETQVWQGSYEASSSNLTVGLTAPKGKGRRLIITHIGSKDGFVRDAADIFIGKKSGDYHEEMDGNHFEKWFETVMPKLKPQSIIVMDNAPYHSVKKEKTPTSSWKKCAIQEWLTEKKVTWNQDLIKIELLQKVNDIKHLYNGYRVEEIAEKFGHKILRLPPPLSLRAQSN
ncbi:DDE_3 domain-containing protein [Trichonephila inaurata madagascariensis]|uniref:DDE_3 domain-containing protein n=1 Tax=Trichonephila inaurata madagascariensis TaxID=2747483 RepID=A0A8X7BQI1_9ARAC|nr:DDE_3 domain-containing protein [Trichonephila inaurata madagascariensis]